MYRYVTKKENFGNRFLKYKTWKNDMEGFHLLFTSTVVMYLENSKICAKNTPNLKIPPEK